MLGERGRRGPAEAASDNRRRGRQVHQPIAQRRQLRVVRRSRVARQRVVNLLALREPLFARGWHGEFGCALDFGEPLGGV